jgi:hypothetical protein
MTPFEVLTAGPATTLDDGAEGEAGAGAEEDAGGEGGDDNLGVGVEAGSAMSAVPVEGW